MGFKRCKPNQALVISGACHETPLLLSGGRKFVWPCCQKVQKLDLSVMKLSLESSKVPTARGVYISVSGAAQVKIDGMNEEMLLRACEIFLDKPTREIQEIILVPFEGHQRSVISKSTLEEITEDREKISKSVFEAASKDLANMGVVVLEYSVKDIR